MMLIYDMPDTLHVIKYDVNIWHARYTIHVIKYNVNIWHARYSTCNKVLC